MAACLLACAEVQEERDTGVLPDIVQEEPALPDAADAAADDGAAPDPPADPLVEDARADDARDAADAADRAEDVRTDDARDAPDAVETTDIPAGPATLLISELDYDQVGGDTAEFLELYNYGSAAVSCAGLEVRLINGNATGGPAPYEVIVLSCATIPPHGFHVIGDAAFLSGITCPNEQALSGDRIENGPDAVALMRTSGSPAIVDQVAYGGAVSGWGEGAPAPADPDTISGVSIQRNPIESDTGDNLSDFHVLAITPCAAPTP